MTSAHGTFNTMQRHRTPLVPSATATLTQTDAGPSTHPVTLSSGTLRLRAAPAEQRRIQWAEDVIDNEGMGKKSSKVCCIYHAPRAVGESSSESDSSSSSSSSSDSDSESEPDTSRARPAGGFARRKPRPRRHRHEHEHDHEGHECGGEASEPGDASGKGKSVKSARRRSPNAYEKMPKKSGGSKKEKS